jgi:hypothetical protein
MEPRPVINVEEFIGKTVGRRRPPVPRGDMQNTLNQVFAGQGHRLWPKGVYRFHSHEDADIWTLKMIRPKKVN